VVQPGGDEHVLIVRPLGGGDDDVAAILTSIESVESASFAPPTVDDLGDASSVSMLQTALRIGFRSTAGPFRSLARLSVEPRSYQFVPLMLALKQDITRLLIADDVGIGKTIEAGLIAAELLALGEVDRLAVLCSPALAEQWQKELREKFAIDAELVIPSTVTRLTRGLMMAESLFDRYPYVVVSTDFIKNHRRLEEFLNHCPDLVIVDEAHTVVSDGQPGSARNATQRFELVSRLAAKPTRHLVLVTATPHSGKEEGFRNLIGLLDPALATLDLDAVKGRELLAKHMVQRRRADIRKYIDEDTKFPSDRAISESPYELTKPYATLFENVLDYAREQVIDLTGEATVRQRVRWWSALGLLRALSSSPQAAAETLRKRAASVDAMSPTEADALGRAAVLDLADHDSIDGFDAAPGADDTGIDLIDPVETLANLTADGTPRSEAGMALLDNKRRLLRLAAQCEDLTNPKDDAKLKVIIAIVKKQLAEGYEPIVFCRFIATADYVAKHLTAALKSSATVISVTGQLPPEERAERIDALARTEGRHVLVATDCLSEGVNLQDHFNTVIHYDLAWNPTRHEQREGRVDRFGQERDIVRALTIYGKDNGIDGIVLDVLIRKHRAISKATGVSVPVPEQSDSIVEALMEGLILRGRRSADQLTLDLQMEPKREELHTAWESAAERQRLSNTKYAHAGIHPDDVAREVALAREALGSSEDVHRFVTEAIRSLGGTVVPGIPDDSSAPGLTATTSTLPIGLKNAIDSAIPGHSEPLPFHADLPAPRRHALTKRTDPAVEAIARYVLDTALEPLVTPSTKRAASRSGVIRTAAVSKRTTLLMVRYRFHLDLPTPTGIRQIVSEDSRFVGFEGNPTDPTWLTSEQVDPLVSAVPSANLERDQAAQFLEGITDSLLHLTPHLNAQAVERETALLSAHRRVRGGANATRRGLSVKAQTPVDVLGIYVLMPNIGSHNGANPASAAK
jgi:superfamily II DNA or RNA helicase